jgi:hypothetical protein
VGNIVLDLNEWLVGKDIFCWVTFMNGDINKMETEWRGGDVSCVGSLERRKICLEYITKILMLFGSVILCEYGKVMGYYWGVMLR